MSFERQRPVGVGVVIDNEQPHPIFGWLEMRWVPIVIDIFLGASSQSAPGAIESVVV